MNDGLLPANEPCPKFGAFEVLSDSAQAESQSEDAADEGEHRFV